KKDIHAIPAQANWIAYFELLQDKAASILNQSNTRTGSDSSNLEEWFLLKQARFLLLVRQDTMLEKSTGNPQQDLIFKLAKGFTKINICTDESADEAINLPLCILLAEQMTDDKTPLLRATCSLIGTLESADALSTVQMIATQNSELAAQIMAKLRSSTTVNGTFNFTGEFEALAKTIYLDAYASKTPLGEITQPQSLAQLFLRADNPFAHEI